MTLRQLALCCGFAAVLGAVALQPSAGQAAPLPSCTALPAKLVGGNIKFVSSQIVAANTAPAGTSASPTVAPALPLPNSLPVGAVFTGATPNANGNTSTVSYCFVVLSFSSESTAIQAQNISIYISLPLNSTDGGVTGSVVDPPLNFTTVQGNWNGRTEGIGGGVCTGNTSVA